VDRTREPSEHGYVFTTALNRNTRRDHRRLPLNEILAELNQRPDLGRAVHGYQVKVGSERRPFWMYLLGDQYAVTDSRPVEPPFGTEREAGLAKSWFERTMPGVASLRETVYTRALVTA